jgi:hypothetical protein
MVEHNRIEKNDGSSLFLLELTCTCMKSDLLTCLETVPSIAGVERAHPGYQVIKSGPQSCLDQPVGNDWYTYIVFEGLDAPFDWTIERQARIWNKLQLSACQLKVARSEV